jgi:hypothetical protein
MARVSRQIEELSAQIARARDAQIEALQQPSPAGILHGLLWEAQAVEVRRKALLSALQTLEQQRDKQLKIYQTAHRNHETLISMKREQRAAYELEQVRTQQKLLDDIFMARRHRI